MAFETERLHMPVTAAGHAARRAALFRESLPAIAERWALGLAWGLMPSRIGGLPALTKLCFDEALSPDYALPDPERAFQKPPGLAGIVHELDLPTLLSAYRRGLYPLAHMPPLKWWSPSERAVLLFDDVHIATKQRKLMRQGRYTVTFDRDFEQVIAACAARREGRWHLTWITPRIMRVYAEAFDAGHAHSFEVWNKTGELVAGGYGLGVGAAFTSESQFFREPNTSKIGMTVLNWHLKLWGYRFNDGKLMGPLLHALGFRDMPRRAFLAKLDAATAEPGRPGRWQVETDLDTVSRWDAKAGRE
jgi:leucyl/phenylalanyl-tRNA---protein transferase